MNKNILCSISTKGRYDSTLPMAMMSVALQTLCPDKLILLDDNDKPVDLRNNPIYQHIFLILNEKGIEWEVLYGQKKGQHYNHHIANNYGYKYVWRVDDDCVPESNVLEKLMAVMTSEVGAVGGSILTTPFIKGIKATGKIEEVKTEPNLQWDYISSTIDVDHLHCSYVYRSKVANFDLRLSPKAHREETMHTYSIKKAGFKVLLTPAITWHLKSPTGGIRSNNNFADYEHDEKIFDIFLQENGISQLTQPVILDCGIGDHYAFKNILPELRKQSQKIVIAACYPDVFFDEEDLKLISIQDAKNIYGNINEYNIYKKMIDWKWKSNVTAAFKKLYIHENSN